MDTVLALIRAVHFAGLMSVFGASVFLLQCEPDEAARQRGLLLWSAAIALVGAFGLVSLATSMTTVFVVRPWLVAALTLLCLRDGLVLPKAVLAGAALLLISVESHAAKAGMTTPLLATGVDALHLLTAAYWVGGLAILVPAASAREMPRLVGLLRRFSRGAAPSVAVLLAAGTANGFIILGAPGLRWTPGYVSLLAIKIVLAGVMVALALTNRFGVLPGLARGDKEAEETIPLTVIAELSCAVAVLLIVGFLGLIPPAQR